MPSWRANKPDCGWRHEGLHQHEAKGHLAVQSWFGPARTGMQPRFLLTIIAAKGLLEKAVLMLSEHGGEGDICPSTSRTHSKHPTAACPWPEVAQDPVANIWISTPPTSVSSCPQRLGVPVLNMQVSLFSASASSHPQHLGPPILNTLVFPVLSWQALGALLHPPRRTSLFQFLSQTKQPRQHIPRRGRESRRASRLQGPGPLSGVILEEEDNWSEIRATTAQSLISISPLNKPQHTPKKPNVAPPAPASSISAPVTRCPDSLCPWASLTDSEVFLKPRWRSTLNPLL